MTSNLPNDRDRTVSARLRSAGLRLTDARRRLLGVLGTSSRPLTLPEILQRDDGLTQSSAYRNLSELCQLGLVDKILTTDDHGRFELATDITDHHHHHVVCESCGRVEDIELSTASEELLDGEARRIGAEQGFVIDSHRLDLLGTCGACAITTESAK